MHKVVKHVQSRSSSGTTSNSFFERVTQAGSPEEDVKTGFLTKEEAQSFADKMNKLNRMSEWVYSVKEEQ